uniref:Uncharacterized protein n=1 Tax=Gossypium raimondii TaxID=29730 RepID=A0A0D2RCY9_GOSRA|nr:hypothetical protein B456_002G261300 [Gossypium raimondii]
MMIALKAIQASFTYSSNHVFFQTRRITTYTKNPILCLSKSNDSESDSDPEPEGDTRKQDLLAQIAMLQAQKIMENIESQMQAFKESQELNMQEIEMNEDQLAEFEDQMEKERNEGLFFKNLTEKKPIDTAKAMEEAEKVKEVTKEKVGSKARRNLYLALITVLAVGIADSLVTGSDWRKVAVLGAILVALFSQFIYEQTVLSEEEKTEKNDENK